MSGGFGDFFDQQLAERNAREKAASDNAMTAETERLKKLDILSAPLREKLTPVIEVAASELHSKGVTLEPNSHVSIANKQGYAYTYFFRLQKKNNNSGIDSSNVFGFRVLENGSIESVVADFLDRGRHNTKILETYEPQNFSQFDVQSVIQQAVKNLVNGKIGE